MVTNHDQGVQNKVKHKVIKIYFGKLSNWLEKHKQWTKFLLTSIMKKWRYEQNEASLFLYTWTIYIIKYKFQKLIICDDPKKVH